MTDKLTKPQREVYMGVAITPGIHASTFDKRVVNKLVKMGALLMAKDGSLKLSPKASAKPGKPTGPTTRGKCLCGCGGMPNKGKSFTQGHDARLRSRVLQFARGKADRASFPKDSATVTYLKTAHWMVPWIWEKVNG